MAEMTKKEFVQRVMVPAMGNIDRRGRTTGEVRALLGMYLSDALNAWDEIERVLAPEATKEETEVEQARRALDSMASRRRAAWREDPSSVFVDPSDLK